MTTTKRKDEFYKPQELLVNPLQVPDYSYGSKQRPLERQAIKSRGSSPLFYLGEFTTALAPANGLRAGYTYRDTTTSKIMVYGKDNTRHG